MRIVLKGFDDFGRKLNRPQGDWLKPIMRKAVAYVHGSIPEYPAPPEGSTYRRTGTLGRTNTHEVRSLSGNDVAGLIGNKTVYAPWVISSEKVEARGPQTRTHKQTGWYTLQAVVFKAGDKVKDIFEQEIRKLLR